MILSLIRLFLLDRIILFLTFMFVFARNFSIRQTNRYLKLCIVGIIFFEPNQIFKETEQIVNKAKGHVKGYIYGFFAPCVSYYLQ
jgi:hypothetical protein